MGKRLKETPHPVQAGGRAESGPAVRAGEEIMRLAILIVTLAVTSCAVRVADLTLVSNRNLGMQPETITREVQGEHCQVRWTLAMQPSLEEAIDRAQSQVPEGNALMNVAVYYVTANYLLITRNCFRVVGDAVHLK